jgi:hypothetical protein
MTKKQKSDDLIERNPKVDRHLVSVYDKLARELEKAGVDMRTRYSISPPLGGTLLSLSTHNRA